VTIAILALALTALLVVPAQARGKKTKITATVGGEVITWKGRYASISYGEGGVFIIATKIARRNKLVPTIGFACAVDLPSLTFPHTQTLGCSANFSRARNGIPESSWLALPNDAVTVTFETYDGKRLTGHVTATMQPVIGSSSPLSFDAEFAGKAILSN
jgi:hypothetical protein